MRSGCVERASVRASAPFAAVVTLKPARFR
jgi:hypothetical protein